MRVILPIDVEPYIGAQFDFVSSYNWPEDTEIKVMHVLHSLMIERTMVSSQIYIEQIMKDARKLAQKMALEMVERFKKECPHLKVHDEIREGDAINEIIRSATEWNADMIVMGSHGRQGIGRVILGSVAYSVLAKAPCKTIILGVPQHKHGKDCSHESSKVEIKLQN